MTDVARTYEEAIDLFTAADLNEEFKGLMLLRLNALMHGLVIAATAPEELVMMNTHGDNWFEELNRVVTEYQRYHS